jgi:predicted phosphodiesterase
MEKTIQPESDILVHAGDTGHYPSQDATIFEYLSQFYKKILVVGGNHNLYNVSNTQRRNFSSWRDKLNFWRDKVSEVKNVEVLDGNIVDVDGCTFGGTMGWYDGSFYYNDYSPYSENIESFWKRYTNDSKLIPGLKHFYDLLEIEKEKIENTFDKCDVMVTHIQPTTRSEFFQPKYRYDKSNAFYSFNYNEQIENAKKTKVWCFGHVHAQQYKMLNNVLLACNPVGYPNENPNFKMMSIEI